MPTIRELRSLDERVNEAAWNRVFPALWAASIRLLQGKLLIGSHLKLACEDISSQVINEVLQGVIEGKPESFNQIVTFDDLEDMTLRIVRRRCIDFYRAQDRRKKVMVDGPLELDPDQVTAGTTCFDGLTREEWDTLIDKLKPPQPEICRAHFWEGLTAAAIGKSLAMPRNTVLSHLHKAKKALRRILDDLR